MLDQFKNILTRAEREVLFHVSKGLSNAEVSNLRHTCVKATKFHLSNIFKKFNVRRRANLILLVHQSQPIKEPVIPVQQQVYEFDEYLPKGLKK